MAESSGKYEEARTNADMLRNTPSNIRRLIGEIQQCEGRQKYIAHTRSPSDGGDVRWYFSKIPIAENGELFDYDVLVHKVSVILYDKSWVIIFLVRY